MVVTDSRPGEGKGLYDTCVCREHVCYASRIKTKAIASYRDVLGYGGLPALTNPTLCKALGRPARRVRLLPAPQHTWCSSICFRLRHPASIRSMPRSSRQFPMGHKRAQASPGVSSWRPKSSPRVPMMVPMPLCCRLAGAALVCGCRLLLPLRHIFCRNGDLSCHLQ